LKRKYKHSLHAKGLALLLPSLMLLQAGCTAVPDGRDPLQMSSSYSRSLDSAAGYDAVRGQYWREFGDDALNKLVEEALKDNPNLERVRQRLLQAEAVAKKSGADLYPSVTVTGGRDLGRGTAAGSGDLSLSGAASYELDIWGKNRASAKSGKLDAFGAAEDLRAAAVTLAAEIIQDWLRLAALREEEALLNRQISINENVMELQQARFSGGIASALDVLQQKEVLARVRAQLPDVQAGQALALNRLAVLAGRSPAEFIPPDQAALPALLPLPGAGLPSLLLEERPDIRAAWLRVSAADWAKEAAAADRLPGVNLTANYATMGAAFGNLFTNWALTLAASLVAPVMDGGTRVAETARQQAVADERFQTYRETVLNALKEVEDALAQNKYQADKITAVEEQLEAARNALAQAQISYTNGSTDYLSVLNGLLNVQSLERQMVQARRDLSLYRVMLYRALGGRGWTDTVMAESAEKQTETENGEEQDVREAL
jgi:NodT family efflux transporter outer membrane factor (OMF) lipoprotein